MVSIPQPNSKHQKEAGVQLEKRARDISKELNQQLGIIINMYICGRHGREGGSCKTQEQPDKGGAHEETTEETERNPWLLESHPQSKSLSVIKSKYWKRNF